PRAMRAPATIAQPIVNVTPSSQRRQQSSSSGLSVRKPPNLAEGLREGDRSRHPDVQRSEGRSDWYAHARVGSRAYRFRHARRFTPHKNDVPVGEGEIPQIGLAACCEEHQAALGRNAPRLEYRPGIMASDPDAAQIVHSAAPEPAV